MNRPLSKLAAVRKVEGGSERRTEVYTPVHEDPSTGPTHKFSTGVEFRKRSNKTTEGIILVHCLLFIVLTTILLFALVSMIQNQQKISAFKMQSRQQANYMWYALQKLSSSIDIKNAHCRLESSNLQSAWELLDQNNLQQICYQNINHMEIRYLIIGDVNSVNERVDIMIRTTPDQSWQKWQMQIRPR